MDILLRPAAPALGRPNYLSTYLLGSGKMKTLTNRFGGYLLYINEESPRPIKNTEISSFSGFYK